VKEETLTNLNFVGRFISWAVCVAIGVSIAAQLTGVKPSFGSGRMGIFTAIFTNWATVLGGLCGVGTGEAIIQKIISHYSRGNKA
jgi:hypothetical protein